MAAGLSPVVSDLEINRLFTVIESKRVEVKIGKDERSCHIYGITVLPKGDIILINSGIGKLNLLSTDYKVVDHVRVPEMPLGICVVSDNQVAVCTSEKKILFFDVEDRKLLKMEREIELTHDCNHVSYMAMHLIISSDDTVNQYTLAGQRVREIYKIDGLGWYRVAVSPSRLYITNYNENKLITVDMQGEVIATLVDNDLDRPTGVCVSPSGQVFVCGYISDTILQVDSQGNQKLATLANKKNDVSCPQSMHFNSRTSSLLLGQNNTDDLLVLKLK
ncbi:uncharacterized protein LOC128209871 [Mya arenaria]|uniref:uncharacterized protein LOC128209871 n=1 Tax=Mya arenaria TaxID=6604 RepID=UPI0022E8B0EC|nr:uncharacterized protein LOC128209871 [Mya arenaria]